MEHIYSVFKNEPLQHAKSFLDNSDANVVSSLSNNNVLAFSSNVDLLVPDECQLGVFVYVIDLNLPYFPNLVATLSENVTVLEWDEKGTKLLVGDKVGNIQVWSMCDFLISEWQLIYSKCFSGDSILAGAWFHKGHRWMINYEKKDSNVSLQEKFSYTKITPSVHQLGKKHTDGYLCITSSGFVFAHLFYSDSKIITGFDFLGKIRARIEKVDIGYMKNGSFLIVTSNGNAKVPLTCYTVNVTVDCCQEKQPKVNLNCQQFASFLLKCNTSSFSSANDTYPTITHLKFIVKETPDAIVVSASGKSGSFIELWELCEKPVILHNCITNLLQQQNKTIDVKPCATVGWKFSTSTATTSQVSAITTPRSCIFDTAQALSYIIVAFQDNTVMCFYRENLQMLSSLNLAKALLTKKTAVYNGHLDNTSPSRSLALTSKLSILRSLQLSWSTCSMVAVDSCSQIHLFRLSPITEPCASISLNYAQLMLEYSLMSGNDYWDILISIKPTFVDTLCDKITEAFITRQSLPMQQKWLDSVLELKAALHRCVNTNVSKTGDYYTIKMLNSISETVKRLIRAREFLENEGPSEKLSNLIQIKPVDVQLQSIDKILLKLDSKDFYVEGIYQHSFKQLLQWVTDLSLNILASIPQLFHPNQSRIPGVGLIFDQKSLNTLRELLVIIRFWGLINSTCLPSIQKLQENLDVIALIFKLLSKIVASNSEKFDESLVDECCLLPNQVNIPQMDLCPKSIGVASPILYINTTPLIFDYGTEPSFTRYNVKVHIIDGAININGNRKVDIVRYIVLGNIDDTSSNIRSCTRCNSVSLRKTPLRSFAVRAWELQWNKKCFCGGLWRVHASNMVSH